MKARIATLTLLSTLIIATPVNAGFLQDIGVNPMGKITTTKSDFDGLTTIMISPAFVRDKDSKFSWPAKFKLGFYWSEKYPKIVGFVVEMDGVTNITSLESKINDKIVSYPTSQELPHWSVGGGQATSSKMFALTLDQAKELINAEKAMLRVNNVMVGYFHIETSSLDPTAKKALVKALPQIEALQPKEAFPKPVAQPIPEASPPAS